MDDVSPVLLARLERLEALETLDAMARMAVAVVESQDAMETNDLDGLQALHAREGVTGDDLAPLTTNPLPPLFMTGAELRRHRLAVDLSLRDFAQGIGFSKDVIYRWETHDVVIPRQVVAHILARLMEARRELEAWRAQRAEMLQWTPPPRDRLASNTRPRRNKTAPPTRQHR